MTAWNNLLSKNNLLMSHEFLFAMEKHQCIGEHFGWVAQYIALYKDQELIGGLPLYQKYNNYGEFVFDYLWADALERQGISYYPKLVATIPYTPATESRLLAKDQDCQKILLNTALELNKRLQSSSLHFLFIKDKEHDIYQEKGFSFRHDIQYHWHNQNYQDFDDFLAHLIRRKRKNIRQERKKVQNINIRILNGHQATEKDWQNFSKFYANTFFEKSGTPTFNFNFFQEIANLKPDNILLVLADLNQECIAGALMYISGDTLYGRHWGCIEHVDCLHFELCYYQGIEYCIKNNLKHFEPGAQGQHKMARGFVPTQTTSAHWISHRDFRTPIDDWCNAEQKAVLDYLSELKSQSVYKNQA